MAALEHQEKSSVTVSVVIAILDDAEPQVHRYLIAHDGTVTAVRRITQEWEAVASSWTLPDSYVFDPFVTAVMEVEITNGSWVWAIPLICHNGRWQQPGVWEDMTRHDILSSIVTQAERYGEGLQSGRTPSILTFISAVSQTFRDPAVLPLKGDNS